jgi:hypothetical protein
MRAFFIWWQTVAETKVYEKAKGESETETGENGSAES